MRTSHNFKDLTGKKFGRLFVIERAGSLRRLATWRCVCDCGNEHITVGARLTSGATKSCGCYNKELLTNRNYVHGKSKTKLYRVWRAMRERCNCETNKRYSDYGGRGIKISEEWSDFNKFEEWALSNGYKETLTIDRIDNNKGYSPDNCRWATSKEQNNNSRNVRYLEYKGETHNVVEWSNILGIKASVIYGRLSNGWSIDRALSQPQRKSRQK